MIKIYYTENFDKFVKKFPKERQDLIKKTIEDYCDHNVLLPRPKSSAITGEIQKVAILPANVVIFYLGSHIYGIVHVSKDCAYRYAQGPPCEPSQASTYKLTLIIFLHDSTSQEVNSSSSLSIPSSI